MRTVEGQIDYLNWLLLGWDMLLPLHSMQPIQHIAKRLRTIAEIEKQREDTGELVMMSLEEWDAICEELTKEDEV